MGEETGISWAHATLNFWVGCTKVSTGDQGACEFCYAETWAKRWPAYRDTWGVGAPRVPFAHLRSKALALERLAGASGEPFYCFSNSLSDIFDKEVPIEWLAEAFDHMRAAPHVTFLLLTKRAPNIIKRATAAGGLPENAGIGITVVTPEEVDRDGPHLLAAKLALRPRFAFFSMEPLMGPADVGPYVGPPDIPFFTAGARLCRELPGGEHCLRAGPHYPREFGCRWSDVDNGGALGHVDWVITGGESGAKARPTHPDWLRSIRDQCAAAGVPYHHKQNGEWAACLSHDGGWWPVGEERYTRLEPNGEQTYDGWPMQKVGKKASGRLLDGVLHDAMPRVP